MRIPSYRRHASGQAIVVIQKKTYYLGEYDSKESRDKYARIIAEYLSCDHKSAFCVSSNDLLIIELVAAYVDHARIYYGLGVNSEVHRISVAVRALVRLYGSERAIDFGPKKLKAVRQFIQDGKHEPAKVRKTPLSRKYINAMTKRIVAMFKWACGEEMIPPDVHAALVHLPPLKRGRCEAFETEAVPPVSDEVVDATLPHLPPVVADMVRFQSLVGCRPGEVCKLKPDMVRRESDIWEIHLDDHKTSWRGKKRIIYVGPKAQKILEPYLTNRCGTDFCFRPIDSERRRRVRKVPESCGNTHGQSNTPRKTSRKLCDHYTTGTYGNAIRRACLANKIDHWAPNQLRHAVGTRVRANGGVEAAQVVLGHSNIVATQIYAEADRQRAIETVKRLG